MTQLSILQQTELLRCRSRDSIPANNRKFNVEEAKFVFTEKILSFIPLHVQRKAFCFYFFIFRRVDRKFFHPPLLLTPLLSLHLLLKSDSASDYKTNAESRIRRENKEGRQGQASFYMARRHLDEIELRTRRNSAK